MTTNDQTKKISDDKKAESGQNKPTKKSKIAALALFIALLSAASVGGLYYWQQQQVSAIAEQLMAQSQQLIDKNQLKNQNLLSQQQQNSNNSINKALNKIKISQQTKISQLENEVAQLSKHRPSEWLVHESQYLIRVAVRSLWLERDPTSAISLLKEADQRLQTLNDPQYFSVRQALNQDIESLQLLPKLTTDNTILSLMGLAQQIKQLPLTKIERVDDITQQQSFKLSENIDDWQENLARSWHKFLSDFITIRRRSDAVEPLMSPKYQQNLRENLSLKIQLAQWAASQGKAHLFKQTLQDVLRWQQQYFDMSNVINIHFSKRIKSLENSVVTVNNPKTLTSLSAIQELINSDTVKENINKVKPIKQPTVNSTTAPEMQQQKPKIEIEKLEPKKKKSVTKDIDPTDKNEAL